MTKTLKIFSFIWFLLTMYGKVEAIVAVSNEKDLEKLIQQ